MPGEIKREKSVAEEWGATFKVYLVIECGIWLPCCYAACYWFAPTIRLMNTPFGRRSVERSSAWLSKNTPSWHATLAKLAGRIEGAPASRAFGEWALINKVLAPVSFPTKMWIARRIVNRRDQAAAAAAAAAANATDSSSVVQRS